MTTQTSRPTFTETLMSPLADLSGPTPDDRRAGLGRVLRRMLSDSGYSVVVFGLALVAFVVVVCGVALGVSTLVLWIGLPVLVGTVLAARGFSSADRVLLRSLQGRDVATPQYLAAPAGAGWVRRLLTPLRDVQSWLEVLWCAVGLVTGAVAFSIAVIWWAAAAGGLTYWFWQRWLPDNDGSLASLLGLGEGRGPEIVLNSAFGIVAALTLPFAVRAGAWLHESLAMALLDSRAELQAELRRATGARTAAQSAELDALRRLERDIHDGPQQRLVRLALDLGRARRQFATDPERAAELLDAALAQAQATVSELRSLSRGIAPPLLVDRGLAVALQELVAGHPLDVALRVDLPDRLAAPVETAVYFTVSEALANVAKHSGAGAVDVVVAREGDLLVARVVDDGTGGAHPAKGHGLAGLATRLAAVGGILEVDSPAGGPTAVAALVPWAVARAGAQG